MRKTVETRSCAEAKMTASRAFTLLELLIVISIIAILASTVIPNFIGFDTEAKLSATITNLNTLRTRITMYRAKEGEYPVSLNDLLTKTYEDMGVQQPYLDKIPAEMISSKSGNNSVVDMKSDEDLSGEGGWAYYSDKAKVMVNVTEPLDGKWGKSKGQVPAEW
ncbi:MAG: type II secretion system protein [Candidatus Omnitrophota bacterium]|nr:type II secretion system protein [Candidatus Omnitrophota bacterium]